LVSPSDDGLGIIFPGAAGYVAAGTPLTFEAHPTPWFYDFYNFETTGLSGISVTRTTFADGIHGYGSFVMPNNNVTIRAMFTYQNRQLTMATSGNGSGTTNPGGTYNIGTLASINASPSDEYNAFSNWVFSGTPDESDGSLLTAVSSIVMSENRTATAVFKQKKNVYASANSEGYWYIVYQHVSGQLMALEGDTAEPNENVLIGCGLEVYTGGFLSTETCTA
jgi:hypothetical protein